MLSNVTPGTAANPTAGFPSWLSSRAQQLVRALLRSGQRRAAIRTLRKLDDRELKDIGLHRDQIEAAVHGSVRANAERRRIG
jgi:uncharacterized protein YjiS (DUF1127 family)